MGCSGSPHLNKTITQHKTGVPHTAPLSEESVKATNLLRKAGEKKVFFLSKGGTRRLEISLFTLAKDLGFSRRNGQGLGSLRKLHATQVYLQAGELAAAESLGHIGGVRTARRSYIDSRAIKLGRLPPRPGSAA